MRTFHKNPPCLCFILTSNMEASPGHCAIIPYQLSIDLHSAECCVPAHTSNVPVTTKECKRTTDETIPRHGAHCMDRW